jgi:DoxX-like protein
MSSSSAAVDREGAPARKTWMVWTGWVVSAIPILMMFMSAAMKLARPPQVIEAFVGKFGYVESSLATIAFLEIASALLYLIPQTSVLGAILCTGYLGGAIATAVRIQDPTYYGPLILGILVWLGLYLREPRLRRLIPIRRKSLS